jgi:hypothetical protein
MNLKHAHDMITTLVAPAACQGGAADAPSGKVCLAWGLNTPSGRVRLARGLNAPSGRVRLAREPDAPSGRVRLARGLNAPSARTTSLEGTCMHDVPAPAPVYEHLMLWHPRMYATPRCCFTDSLGKATPPLCSTVRWDRCQPRDTAPPTPTRLTRRALKGGPTGTLEYFFRDYTGLCRDVRPAGAVFPVAVNPVRPSLPLQRHAGHCDDILDAVGVHGDGTRPWPPLCRVWTPRWRHPRTGPWRRPDDQPPRRDPRSCSCTSTGCATMPRLEQDSPGRPSAPWHCSPRLHT